MPKKILTEYHLNKRVHLPRLYDLRKFCTLNEVPHVFVYNHLGITPNTFISKSKNQTWTLKEIIEVAKLLKLELYY